MRKFLGEGLFFVELVLFFYFFSVSSEFMSPELTPSSFQEKDELVSVPSSKPNKYDAESRNQVVDVGGRIFFFRFRIGPALVAQLGRVISGVSCLMASGKIVVFLDDVWGSMIRV
jgi:hypothetical protein